MCGDKALELINYSYIRTRVASLIITSKLEAAVVPISVISFVSTCFNDIFSRSFETDRHLYYMGLCKSCCIPISGIGIHILTYLGPEAVVVLGF